MKIASSYREKELIFSSLCFSRLSRLGTLILYFKKTFFLFCFFFSLLKRFVFPFYLFCFLFLFWKKNSATIFNSSSKYLFLSLNFGWWNSKRRRKKTAKKTFFFVASPIRSKIKTDILWDMQITQSKIIIWGVVFTFKLLTINLHSTTSTTTQQHFDVIHWSRLFISIDKH